MADLDQCEGLRALQRSPFLLTYPLLLGGIAPASGPLAGLHNRGGDSICASDRPHSWPGSVIVPGGMEPLI